jgi:hypothetical protein
MEKKEKPILIETTELGIVVKYYHDKGRASVTFEAKEDAYYPNNDTQGFATFDTLNDGSFTDKFEDGDTYLSGRVGWDGCSHYYFGDGEGYLHLCGIENIRQLKETVEHIYQTCGKIMREDGVYLADEEFNLLKQ